MKKLSKLELVLAVLLTLILVACDESASPKVAQVKTAAIPTPTSTIAPAPKSVRDIPLPPNAINEGINKRGEVDTLFFSVPDTVFKDRMEILEFYRRELPKFGWSLCDSKDKECEFDWTSDVAVENYRYGNSPQGPFLQVQVSTFSFGINGWLLYRTGL